MQENNRHRLRIPRRPKWNQATTKRHLDAAERESFLQWRRALAKYACTRQARAKQHLHSASVVLTSRIELQITDLQVTACSVDRLVIGIYLRRAVH